MASSPAPLSPLAHVAIAAAQALGWSIFIEAAGARVRLGPAGRPGRDLVITLGQARGGDADEAQAA